MLRIALILIAITAIILTSLYTEEVKKIIAFTKQVNKSDKPSKSTQQSFYKWQDEQGQWYISDSAPEGVNALIVQVDTSANVIKSVKLPKEEEVKKKAAVKAEISPFIPMTVNPAQVSDLMNQAKDVERLLQERDNQARKAL